MSTQINLEEVTTITYVHFNGSKRTADAVYDLRCASKTQPTNTRWRIWETEIDIDINSLDTIAKLLIDLGGTDNMYSVGHKLNYLYYDVNCNYDYINTNRVDVSKTGYIIPSFTQYYRLSNHHVATEKNFDWCTLSHHDDYYTTKLTILGTSSFINYSADAAASIGSNLMSIDAIYIGAQGISYSGGLSFKCDQLNPVYNHKNKPYRGDIFYTQDGGGNEPVNVIFNKNTMSALLERAAMPKMLIGVRGAKISMLFNYVNLEPRIIKASPLRTITGHTLLTNGDLVTYSQFISQGAYTELMYFPSISAGISKYDINGVYLGDEWEFKITLRTDVSQVAKDIDLQIGSDVDFTTALVVSYNNTHFPFYITKTTATVSDDMGNPCKQVTFNIKANYNLANEDPVIIPGHQYVFLFTPGF